MRHSFQIIKPNDKPYGADWEAMTDESLLHRLLYLQLVCEAKYEEEPDAANKQKFQRAMYAIKSARTNILSVQRKGK